MPLRRQHIVFSIWAISSLICYLVIAYLIPRTASLTLLACWSISFALYFLVIADNRLKVNFNILLFSAILFRLIFIVAVPSLSDDYFRFIWDGHLLNEGLSPYSFLPSQLSRDTQLEQLLYDGLNSPNYYSVYPPVMQLTFWLSTYITPNNIIGPIVIMRTVLILADIGSIFIILQLLKKWNIPKQRIFLYALNPLIIIELVGNLHFEGLMIFFLLASIYLLLYKRIILSGILYSIAICTKLIPLLLVPLLFRRLNIKELIAFGISGVTTTILLFYPFLSLSELKNIFQSISLYFQHFEFNASIFYVIRAIGYYVKGYDIIAVAGRILPIIFGSYILVELIRSKTTSLITFWERSLWILFIYYLLALIVHPWYISVLVLCTVFTKMRFAILWSVLIGFTYRTYSQTPYAENIWIVLAEYVLVICYMIYELNQTKIRISL